MKYTEPTVFLMGETKLYQPGVRAYFESIGAADWMTDAPSDSEELVEIMARSCYMSFNTPSQSVSQLNKNLSSAREGNDKYLENILKHRHGSVLEHAVLNFMFTNVSRVVTHELVRHRAGTAISQQSLRYVRLDSDEMYIPDCIADIPEAREAAERLLANNLRDVAILEEALGLNEAKISFKEKKEKTSALRRFKFQGLATQIGWSANLRALRHVIEMRTDPSAEEEIRLLFAQVACLCKERYPNVFGDFVEENHKGISWFHTEHRKV